METKKGYKKKLIQPLLIDEDWKNEWHDMPEFKQEPMETYAKIVFRFASKEDLNNFSKLINQNLTNETRSAWYPKMEKGFNSNKRYVDES